MKTFRQVLPIILAIIAIMMVFVGWGKANGLDEFNKSFSPPDPLTSYHYKDDSNWTTWNKVLFGSAVGLYGAGDTITSLGADSRGCVESNPLLGEHPGAGLIVVSKVAALGFSWYLTEYVMKDSKYQQEYRNLLYGALSLLGGCAAYNNATVNCD